MKLLGRILIPIITLITILMGVSGYISYTESASSLKRSVIDNLRGEAESLKRMTNTVLTDCLNSVVRFSEEANLRDFFAADPHDKEKGLELAKWLDALIKTYPFIDRVNVFDPEGSIISSSNPTVIGQNFKTRAYFTTAIGGSNFMSEPFMSNITKQGVLIVSAPVLVDRKVVGVVNATISLPHYFQTVIAPVHVGERGYACAIDAQGRIVAHRQADRLFRDDMPASPSYKEMASSPDGVIEFVNNSGVDSFAYFAKEPFSRMTLVVQADKNDVFSDLDKLTRKAIIVVLAGIALGIIVLVFLVRPIVRALNRGVVYAAEIAEGNLDGELNVHRKDEIGILADALRAIPESLKSIIAEYQRLESEIINGNITIQGDASKFSGDFAKLVHGTNDMLDRYQLILNALTAPVVVLDKTLRIVYMNESARAIAGNDFMGKTCGQVMAREDFGTPACAMQRAVDTLRPASGETVAHPQGKNLDISYTAIPFVDKEGKLATVLQLITDLTAIKSTQRTIVEVANQAQDISNRVATASEQLSAQVEQVSKGADVQRGRAASTATAMEEMNSTVMEVARNAGTASQQAEDSRSKAKEGAGLVNQVIEAINQVNVVASALESNMQQLGVQAEAIGSVMNVISDIADQTNLLALNAAIEAARAGEAGRGFAVVADEVRKLAEKTMGATTEVGSSIKGIQESTSENIRRVADAGQGVSKATELATVSGQALEEIHRLVNDNAALIAGIATAAEQQSATSEEINQAIDDINRIADDTAGGMEQSSSAVHELSRMAQELRALLERLQQ